MLFVASLVIVATLQGVSAARSTIHRFDMPSRGRTTWSEGKAFCESKKLRLCLREELCPNGKRATPYEGNQGGIQWTPSALGPGAWTAVSHTDKNTLCMTHHEQYGGVPGWGEQDHLDHGHRDHDRLYCCEDALGGCIRENAWGFYWERFPTGFDVANGDGDNVGTLGKYGELALMGTFDSASEAYAYALANDIGAFTWFPHNSHYANVRGTAWGPNYAKPGMFTRMVDSSWYKALYPRTEKTTAYTFILTEEGLSDTTIHRMNGRVDSGGCAANTIDFNNLPQPGGPRRGSGPCAYGTILPNHDGSSDKYMTYYTKAECDQIGGVHVPNGECLKGLNAGGGSYTAQCSYDAPADGSDLQLANSDGSTTTFRSYNSCDLDNK